MVWPQEALPRIPGTYSSAVAITPADGVTFAPARAIYVGTGGVLFGQTSDGSAVITTVVAGDVLKIRIDAVAATGTTASNLLALY